MPNGYWDRILHVDLTAANHADRVARRGVLAPAPGRPLADRPLPAAGGAQRAPTRLGPDNVLVFAAGVLTGTPFPGAGRHSVGAKSPLTGAFGESEAGGFWGAELQHAGWDGIVVHGRADEAGLPVDQGRHTSRSATPAHLWGKRPARSRTRIRAEHGDRLVRVAQTGIAGENLVRYALVVNDLNEVAGRGGHGRRDGLQEPQGDRRARQAARCRWPTPSRSRRPRDVGHRHDGRQSLQLPPLRHRRGHDRASTSKGHLIVRNFQDGQWDAGQVQAIDAKTIAETYGQKMDGCYACSVRCKKRVEGRGDGRGAAGSAARSTRRSARSAPT